MLLFLTAFLFFRCGSSQGIWRRASSCVPCGLSTFTCGVLVLLLLEPLLCLCLLVPPLVRSQRMRSHIFLREVISEAGAVRDVVAAPLRAHSVRGVATSVSFLRNWSISKVLEAATWRSNSLNASLYFRDILYVFQGLRSLGPFVAAGSIVNPS